MEIADIRKAQRNKAEAQKRALLAEAPRPNIQALAPTMDQPLPLTEHSLAPIILCAACKYWERSDSKAPFAACGLSRRYGLPVAAITTDKTTCSLAETR